MTPAEARKWARSAERHNDPAKAKLWLKYADDLEAQQGPRPLDGKMKAAGEG